MGACCTRPSYVEANEKPYPTHHTARLYNLSPADVSGGGGAATGAAWGAPPPSGPEYPPTGYPEPKRYDTWRPPPPGTLGGQRVAAGSRRNACKIDLLANAPAAASGLRNAPALCPPLLVLQTQASTQARSSPTRTRRLSATRRAGPAPWAWRAPPCWAQAPACSAARCWRT